MKSDISSILIFRKCVAYDGVRKMNASTGWLCASLAEDTAALAMSEWNTTTIAAADAVVSLYDCDRQTDTDDTSVSERRNPSKWI